MFHAFGPDTRGVGGGTPLPDPAPPQAPRSMTRSRSSRAASPRRARGSTISSARRRAGKLLDTLPLRWPLRGEVNSGFGPRISPWNGAREQHNGIDIGGLPGTPVTAPAAGTVDRRRSGRRLREARAHRPRERRPLAYGHLKKIEVKAGEHVEKGQRIGLVGSTGRSTGPHLHYEILVAGKASTRAASSGSRRRNVTARHAGRPRAAQRPRLDPRISGAGTPVAKGVCATPHDSSCSRSARPADRGCRQGKASGRSRARPTSRPRSTDVPVRRSHAADGGVQPWKNHGQYVSCVVHVRNALRKGHCFSDDSLPPRARPLRRLARRAAREGWCICGLPTDATCTTRRGRHPDGTCSNDAGRACDTAANCAKTARQPRRDGVRGGRRDERGRGQRRHGDVLAERRVPRFDRVLAITDPGARGGTPSLRGTTRRHHAGTSHHGTPRAAAPGPLACGSC
jgi:murein DD-endopeptidase MepM/ murein hydrolase activator NlpD